MAAAKKRSPGRPAGGSEELVSRVLEVTLRHLVRDGYEAMRIEEVARESGTNKTTVYRRWPKKSDLVLAALGRYREADVPFRETGSLRDDLIAVLTKKARRIATPEGRAIGRAISSAGIDSDDALVDRIRAIRYAPFVAVLSAAVVRGELSPTVDAPFVAELLLAPVLHRLLVTGESVGASLVARIVDAVLPGLPRPVRRSTRGPREMN
jgi:AcrR family transcriptional regulator